MAGLVDYVGASVAIVFGFLIMNIVRQILPQAQHEPPTVFHWLPFVGNAVQYGIDPYSFFVKCRVKYGDIFTFVLFGKRITCYFGVNGNDFVLNGKQQDLNAEEIYSPLTTPVFGSDVVYDCPNSKLMEQKKFVKFGLTQHALECHVPRIEGEVLDYIETAPFLQGTNGTVDIPRMMQEMTIFTAARSLQGDEVREKLTNEMATLYHHLDQGFKPINFLMPWAPLPNNRRRDVAHAKMREIYMDIIKQRRQSKEEVGSDMIWNLMNCKYKNGTPVPDKEIAHMMITLLMAGQHTSSSASSWMILHLASRPDITEELYDEQVTQLSKNGNLEPLRYADLDKLPLLRNVVKETLRVHSSIHSVMRKVKQPLKIPNTPYIVTPDKVLLASPLVTARGEEYFTNASEWEPHRWDARSPAEDDGDFDFDNELSFSKGSKSPYLPFGAGRHRCIGEKFAYVHLHVIVGTLVRHFRFHTLNNDRSVPGTDYTSLFSTPMKPSIIRWERR